MEIQTMGIDLAKTVFHLVGLNARGDVVVQRRIAAAAAGGILSSPGKAKWKFLIHPQLAARSSVRFAADVVNPIHSARKRTEAR